MCTTTVQIFTCTVNQGFFEGSFLTMGDPSRSGVNFYKNETNATDFSMGKLVEFSYIKLKYCVRALTK